SILSPDGKVLAELNHAGLLTLWNAEDGSVLRSHKPPKGAFNALAFPPDGKGVLVGEDGHQFHLFDLKTGLPQQIFGIDAAASRVGQMAISPDGKWLATAGGRKAPNPSVWPHDRFLRLWDLKRGVVARTIDFPEDSGVRSLLFTPDSRTVIAAVAG